MELSMSFQAILWAAAARIIIRPANTIFRVFKTAVSRNGDFAPEIIRIDYGGENVEATRFQFLNVSVKAVRTGTSTRNQRIERMWRDLMEKVGIFCKELFESFDEEYGTEPKHIVHRFVLHYLFKGRINEDIDNFVDAWNKHGIRTEGEKSPAQMLLLGERRSCGVAVDLGGAAELHDVDSDSESDSEGEGDRIAQVECDPVVCMLTEDQLTFFEQRVRRLTMLDNQETFVPALIHAFAIYAEAAAI